ncbi:riboflavin synthase alpha chain [Anseongella ginsenosidimutans]|uniref:Riboflavin synthase n=1 Tax=Anseongella ginsenosidimutans TaxID=496056 RepID=A0A4R3KQ33_9SPHI|nr:riboflavin synthase [Anseongella ginsenosidimutans]QEC52742.1 riboflavin synthase [Anseongella ginsenosidimutans]TCS85498.1 riboflavin synthase alpha chain [Anseongella ginsenosidimutans]
MFTGIIEAMGKVVSLEKDRGNVHLTLESELAPALKVDQSLSHNGVCLTVVETGDAAYKVTAISETLSRSNIGLLKTGHLVNLERSLLMNGRLDGHIVQGHVDQTAECLEVREQGGSYLFVFGYAPLPGNVTVEKGSICVNGVSLTVVDSLPGKFSVAVIPYTFDHTNFSAIRPGDTVNLEFDIIGKYVRRLMNL